MLVRNVTFCHPINSFRICSHRKAATFFGTTTCSTASLTSRQLRRRKDVVTPREDIATIEKLMETLKVATALLCEEENITLSIVVPFQANLKKHIHLAESDLYSITEIR